MKIVQNSKEVFNHHLRIKKKKGLAVYVFVCYCDCFIPLNCIKARAETDIYSDDDDTWMKQMMIDVVGIHNYSKYNHSWCISLNSSKKPESKWRIEWMQEIERKGEEKRKREEEGIDTQSQWIPLHIE